MACMYYKVYYFIVNILNRNYIYIYMYVGAELVLRHIRNGEELVPIDLNRNYDFNFQQLNFIPSVQILPVSNVHMCTVYSV